jgi:UDP:flavonoid glycosyltransferase YjiC (YdhE family)
MRVLVTASGWTGLYRTMVPVCWALLGAGHEVRVACTPGEADRVMHAGLTPVPVLDSWDMVFQGRMQNVLDALQGAWPFPQLPLHPVTGRPMESLDEFNLGAYMATAKPEIAGRTRRSTDAAVAFARAWRPDVVLHDLLSLEGLLVARALDVPDLAHPWGPIGTHEDDPRFTALPVDFSDAFARYGLAAASFDGSYFVDPNPAGLAPLTELPRLPVRYVPYNGGGVAPGWVLEPPPKPRVCVVWGNSVTAMFGPCSWAVPPVVSALSTLDVEVVVTLNAADFASLGEVPSSVRAVSNVPVDTFLSSCSLVVHHGGGNAVLGGALAGIPQLAITNGHDQHLIGRKLAASGAGERLMGHEVSVDAVRELAVRLLSAQSYRERARELRAQIVTAPSPNALVSTVEGLALVRAGS